MENKSFRADFHNPHQNAVVSQSWIGSLDNAYREGFKQATLILLAAASAEAYDEPDTEGPTPVYLDAVVYPICFTARHFTELFLKDSIRAVSTLGSNAVQVGTIATHDLAALWEDFATAITRDSRLAELGMPLEDVFKDIAKVDNTGMTFRYSHDLDQNVHLPGLEHISLSVLGDRLRKMFEHAEEFSLCLEYLQREYAQGTFTGKLHRADIEIIARKLPPYANWAEELKPIKKEICDLFSLSSNDFSKALEKIKCHREFSSLIGIEIPLAELPADVFERLARIHDKKVGHDAITREEWLSLDAVMEINSQESFSESYDIYLKQISDPNCEERLDPEYLERKAYTRGQHLRGGLLKLGQQTLLAELAKAIPHLAEPRKVPSEADSARAAEALSASLNKMFERMAGTNTSRAT